MRSLAASPDSRLSPLLLGVFCRCGNVLQNRLYVSLLRIKNFSFERGFGFIESEASECFVHGSEYQLAQPVGSSLTFAPLLRRMLQSPSMKVSFAQTGCCLCPGCKERHCLPIPLPFLGLLPHL